MDERDDSVWQTWREEANKFDYFVCGVSGAIFTYVIKDYSPKRLGFNSSLFETVALIFLAASFYFGIKRIERNLTCLSTNHQKLFHDSDVRRMLLSLSQNQEHYQTSTGIVNRSELQQRIAISVEKIKAAEIAGEKARGQALRFYNHRNTCLILGFLTIFLAKVLLPYETTTPQPHAVVLQTTNKTTLPIQPAPRQTNTPSKK